MLPLKASAGIKIAGYDIPRGATVIAWEQPTEFRPDRFLEEDIDVKGHDFRVPRWTLPADVDMSESPWLVTFMRTPPRAVAATRLPLRWYRRVPAEM
ncbi:hypothetical protein GW17_00033795 [Ensete ventricosum]|nr:hypothetical protein GW17_00033795 [Ensete ventricosum]